MPNLRRRLLPSLVTLAALVPCRAQERKAPAVEHLTVETVCEADGRAVPRLSGEDLSEAAARARRWVERKVTWRVGPKPIDKESGLANELERICLDRSTWRESPNNPGIVEPLPVRLKPDAGARWIDIVRLHDAVLQAGFREVDYDGIGTRYFVGKEVDEPVVGRGALVVPECVFNDALGDFSAGALTLPPLGLTIWLGGATHVQLPATISPTANTTSVALPIPANPAFRGLAVFLQMFHIDGAAMPSGSSGLRLRLQ